MRAVCGSCPPPSPARSTPSVAQPYSAGHTSRTVSGASASGRGLTPPTVSLVAGCGPGRPGGRSSGRSEAPLAAASRGSWGGGQGHMAASAAAGCSAWRTLAPHCCCGWRRRRSGVALAGSAVAGLTGDPGPQCKCGKVGTTAAPLDLSSVAGTGHAPPARRRVVFRLGGTALPGSAGQRDQARADPCGGNKK